MQRTVECVKLGREFPGLGKPPFPGDTAAPGKVEPPVALAPGPVIMQTLLQHSL